LQDKKLTTVMMLTAVTAVFMGAGHVAAFAQTAEESEVTSLSGGSGGVGQILSQSMSDDNGAETSVTPLTNNNSPDGDLEEETDSRTNAAEETEQEESTAADIEETEGLVGMELLPLIEELFVDLDAEGLVGMELLPLIEGLFGSFSG
jgi:hypothetical protein